MISIQAHGFDELSRALRELPMKNSRNVMRRSIRSGMKVLLDEAKRNVPNRTGVLKKSLGVKFKRSRQGVIHIEMGPRRNKDKKKDPWYAHIVEFGSKAHSVRRGDKLNSIRRNRGAKLHPGARSKPFLRPAFDTKAEAAIVKFRDEVFRNIEVEIMRLAN